MEVPDTPTLKNKISQLNGDVKPYTDSPLKYLPFDFTNLISSKKLYAIIPVIVFLLLIILRPSFVMNSTLVNNENKTKISYGKLFLVWLIISFMVLLGIFGYNYKNK